LWSFHSLFRAELGNEKLLFHGSRISNWVGLLSRGILMPKVLFFFSCALASFLNAEKVVVAAGGGRTDAGNLGNGIYFGETACTSVQYATVGKKGTGFMLLCRCAILPILLDFLIKSRVIIIRTRTRCRFSRRVALGKVKDFTKITRGMNEPPAGYHSVHGVRRTHSVQSDFEDDEYVVFDTAQQRQEYLVEFKRVPVCFPIQLFFFFRFVSVSPFSSLTLLLTLASAPHAHLAVAVRPAAANLPGELPLLEERAGPLGFCSTAGAVPGSRSADPSSGGDATDLFFFFLFSRLHMTESFAGRS
jgi:hypothetical protein